MDSETITVMIGLFALNYGGMFILANKVNTYNRALSILCREHAKNHGLTEIGL